MLIYELDLILFFSQKKRGFRLFLILGIALFQYMYLALHRLTSNQ